jgi:hypothetical protein
MLPKTTEILFFPFYCLMTGQLVLCKYVALLKSYNAVYPQTQDMGHNICYNEFWLTGILSN